MSFCDAYAVLQAKCVRCHAEPPRNGAPFSLVTYADTQQPAPSRREPERMRADRMLDAVESGAMPLTSFLLDPPVEGLSCEEKATLVAWLKEGAKPPDGDASCDARAPTLLGCSEGGAAGSGER